MVAKVMKQRLYIRYTLRAKKTITLMINELLLLPLLVRSLMSYDKNVIISTMYSSAFARLCRTSRRGEKIRGTVYRGGGGETHADSRKI